MEEDRPTTLHKFRLMYWERFVPKHDDDLLQVYLKRGRNARVIIENCKAASIENCKAASIENCDDLGYAKISHTVYITSPYRKVTLPMGTSTGQAVLARKGSYE